MSKLHNLTSSYVKENVSVKEMEMGYLSQVISLCLLLLKFVIDQKTKNHKNARPCIQPGEQLKKAGPKRRKYLSLFGMLEYIRPSFVISKIGMIYPVDELLEMPANLWSYNLQELVGENATLINFRESVRLLNKLLDLNLSSTGSERNTEQLGKCVENFYKNKEIEKPIGPVCFSASFDGKGVPKIIAPPTEPVRNLKRLSKGQKKGKKQMATVGVISHFEPKKRSVSSIINGLMRHYESRKGKKQTDSQETTLKKQINDNRWHQGIHRRGFLADQEKCIDYGIRYIKDRINHKQSRFVIPIDAGIGLEDKVLKSIDKHGLQDRFDGIILDIVHVTEYVWDCANAVLGESSNLRADWVKKTLEDLLNSQTTKVIKDLEKIVEKGNLSESRRAKIQTSLTYFTNHQHKMDYKTFLDKGYPVSSALVESNCKHLVKDRMEHSGMRWSSKGAQYMLDTRAVKLNGDMESFIKFVQNKKKKNIFSTAA